MAGGPSDASVGGSREAPAYVAVVGPGDPSPVDAAAEAVGRELARRGAVVVCGAAAEGGVSVGLLPGVERAEASRWVTVAIPTGLGELRNGLVVRAADAVIALAGGHGTLSEIGFALKTGRPVVGLGTWEIEGVVRASDPADAVARALEAAS